MVMLPFTLSFISTKITTPEGKNTSTLEPNIINPSSSLCFTSSPSFTLQNIRLAIMTAICLSGSRKNAMIKTKKATEIARNVILITTTFSNTKTRANTIKNGNDFLINTHKN